MWQNPVLSFRAAKVVYRPSGQKAIGKGPVLSFQSILTYDIVSPGAKEWGRRLAASELQSSVTYVTRPR